VVLALLIDALGPPIRGAALLSVVPGQGQAAQADTASQDKDKLADTYLRLCRNCHESVLVLHRRTRTGWQDVIDQMLEKGATGADEDFSLVLRYLLRDYGQVNVNQANAEDLALVLGLSPAEAKTVVAHREQNGKFKDFDALLKVSGVDTKALESHREAIQF
jgi:competence protein ComEA